MTTSVVIVSYRPGDWLAPCVASVMDQADQVVVVDNGSGGAATGIARAAGAEIAASAVNRGFAGGFNLGLERVRGDVVAVLNDDATADAGWLRGAAKVLEDPSVAAVTPKVLLTGWWGEVVLDDPTWTAPNDARPIGRRVTSIAVDGVDVLERAIGGGLHRLEQQEAASHWIRWRWTAGGVPFYVPLDADGTGSVTVNGEPVEVRATCRLVNHVGSSLYDHGAYADIGFGAPDDGRFESRTEPFGFSGTAPAFRVDVLRRLGSLTNRFFAYYEDTDWSFRAHLVGLRIVCEPALTIRHRLSATSGGSSDPHVQFLAERNCMLTLVRNAPVAVAGGAVRKRLDEGPHDQVRASLRRNLPWAVATRLAMRRLWTTSPAEVWARWAGVGLRWDASPADLAWIAEHAAAVDVHPSTRPSANLVARRVSAAREAE